MQAWIISAIGALLALTAANGIRPARAEPVPDFPMFVDGKPVFRHIESGNPDILRSEADLSLVDEAALRAYAAQRKDVRVSDIRRAISDATYSTYSGFHGTQIEYAGADGSVYLWYPGNSTILRGQWKPRQVFVEYFVNGKLLRRFENSQVCFRYGAGTYNPATGHTGDGWECQPFQAYRKHIAETKRGDFLRMKTRFEVPFVLSKEKFSLAALRARIRS
ncbi:hypothetical protein [Methylorubrum zatmanii]